MIKDNYKIISNFCWSSGKVENDRLVNEDATATFDVVKDERTYHFVILMDGATGLGKNNRIEEGCTSAEWLVKNVINELKESFTIYPTVEIKNAVKEAIVKAAIDVEEFEKKNNISLKRYERPSASLAILRVDEKMQKYFYLEILIQL